MRTLNVVDGVTTFDSATDAAAGVGVSFHGSLDFTPTRHTYLFNLDVANGETVVGGSGGKALVGIHIGTDSEAVDTAAGIEINNIGHSDGIYVGVHGKADEASSPSGIGIDLNRALGTDLESHAQNTGRGLQVWDWSTTNQGSTGPHALYLRKHSNANTQHRLLYLYGNRDLLHFETPEGAGYNAGLPLVQIANGGTSKFSLTAGGDAIFGGLHGPYFTMDSGNQAYILGLGSSLIMRMGAGGFDIYDNTEDLKMSFAATGHLRWRETGLEQTTVGAAGAASALPATPSKYLRVMDSAGTEYVIPAYAAA